MGDAVDLQFRLAQVEREATDLLDAGQDEHALAGDDLEPQALARPVGRVVLTQPADDQRLVGLRDAPHETEDEEQEHQRPDDDAGDDHGVLLFLPYMGATTTVRGGKYSTTTTRVPTSIVSPLSVL